MKNVTLDFVTKVLRLFEDSNQLIFWRTDEDFSPITFWVNCNDIFYWGASDAEEITPENISLLEQCCIECGDGFAVEASILFCAKMRNMRPQNDIYNHFDKKFWPLFNACGLKREINIGNPAKYPED